MRVHADPFFQIQIFLFFNKIPQVARFLKLYFYFNQMNQVGAYYNSSPFQKCP